MSVLNGLIPAQTGAGKAVAPTYPRYSALMNGTRYIQLDNEIALDGDFEIQLTWERRDRQPDNTGTTVLLGSENDGSDRLIAYDSDHPNGANRIAFVEDSSFRNFDNALVGVVQGQFVKIKLTYLEGSVNLYIDGNLIETKSVPVNPFSVTTIGANGTGGVQSRGILSDVKITDLSKLPKGTYLSDRAGIYTDVSIPVAVGDVLTFDYLYRADSGNQVIFSTAARSAPFSATTSGLVNFNTDFNTQVKVNGDVVGTGNFTFEEGETYAIQTTIGEIDTITKIGANSNSGQENEGVIANFNLNSGETVFRFDDVIDNGDNTGIAPQTGTSTVADGFIPSFDPLDDLYVAEPNTTYYPINEQSGVQVLAYDENGDPWSHNLWGEQAIASISQTVTRLGVNDYEFLNAAQFNSVTQFIEELIDGSTVRVSFEIYDYVSGQFFVAIRGENDQGTTPNYAQNGFYSADVLIDVTTGNTALQAVLTCRGGLPNTFKVRNVVMEVFKDGEFTPDADREYQNSFTGVGSVYTIDSTDAPTRYFNALPIDSFGSLAVDTVGALSGVTTQGLPLTVNGRIAATIDAPVDNVTGGTPLSAGKVAMGSGVVTRHSSGVPYTADSQIAVIVR